MSLLVTGGKGFIGSNFVLDWIAQSNEPVINLDKLTYAGNIENLQSLNGDRRHVFVQGDIGELRISNFMLWQTTYTELFFSNVLWPDFNTQELDRATHWYALCDRRFGGISTSPSPSTAPPWLPTTPFSACISSPN